MAYRPLTLARTICRVDYRPKAVLYYANRANVADFYFPNPYPDWEYGTTALKLVDHDRRVRLTLEAGSVVIEVDTPQAIPDVHSHFLEVVDRARNQFLGKVKPYRAGWRMVFVLEHSSFDELFPIFNSNTTDGLPWSRIRDLKIRDSAFTFYYGPKTDGLNLRMGVLNATQAKALCEELQFKTPLKLDIEDGCLLVDLDRFRTTGITKKSLGEMMGEHKRMSSIAEDLAQAVLKNTKQSDKA